MPVKLGIALELCRVKAGLTQEEVAVYAGISAATVGATEHGGNARLSTLQSLADVYGIKLSELIRQAEELDEEVTP